MNEEEKRTLFRRVNGYTQFKDIPESRRVSVQFRMPMSCLERWERLFLGNEKPELNEDWWTQVVEAAVTDLEKHWNRNQTIPDSETFLQQCRSGFVSYHRLNVQVESCLEGIHSTLDVVGVLRRSTKSRRLQVSGVTDSGSIETINGLTSFCRSFRAAMTSGEPPIPTSYRDIRVNPKLIVVAPLFEELFVHEISYKAVIVACVSSLAWLFDTLGSIPEDGSMDSYLKTCVKEHSELLNELKKKAAFLEKDCMKVVTSAMAISGMLNSRVRNQRNKGM